MPTPDEVRADLHAARGDLDAALRASAEATWERKPEGGEGEDAWSAREAAEHVVRAEIFYATAVCEACGYEVPDSPLDDPLELATPDAAQAALGRAIEAADAKIRDVTEADLEKKHERMGAVADLFASWTDHVRLHADQIEAAAS